MMHQGYNKVQLLEKEKKHGENYLLVELLYQRPLVPDLEHDPLILMQKMELLWKELNKKFINKEAWAGTEELAKEYVVLAARLAVVAKEFEAKIASDKLEIAEIVAQTLARFAPPPSDSKLST